MPTIAIIEKFRNEFEDYLANPRSSTAPELALAH
jgi:hypothetical protein